ncbi:MAG: hypothetical protein ACREVX_14535 [Clostridium sp.]|uniref:hypothetical protein n=1 Tax=Clostridium sp. TaxID=1506 RepID=UPI003D6DA2D8
MEELIFIISIMFSCILFLVLFEKLNMTLLNSAQKFISKFKRRKIYYYVIIIIIIVSNALFLGFIHLHPVKSGIIYGLLFTFVNIIFEEV